MRDRLALEAAAAAAFIALSALAAKAQDTTGPAVDLARSSERALTMFSCAILAQNAAGVTATARAEADGVRHERAAHAFSREGREAARAAGEAFRGLGRERGAAAMFGGYEELFEGAEPDFFTGFYFGQAMLDVNERLSMAVDGEFADLDEAASAFAAEAARAFDLQCGAIGSAE